MDIAKDIRDRITSAAGALYDEVERSDFPTVAAVRALAGVDMNAASIVMREWRRAQTAQAAPLAVEVPEKVRASSAVALGALWAEAQSLANESLVAAQAGWEAERAEAETLRGELSAAFDAKEHELRAALSEIAALQAAATESLDRMRALTEDLARSSERAGTAEARALEIERRADDLSHELERVHAQSQAERDKLDSDVARAQAELKSERERSTGDLARVRADLEAVRADLALLRAKADADATHKSEIRKEHATEVGALTERMNKVEAERDAARQGMSEAREEAARLSGKVEAMAAVHADLTRLAQAGQDTKPGKGSK